MSGLSDPDFRSRARASLARAKAELVSGEVSRLRYAALELRDAMEALTYDRMRAYRAEIPAEEYATWQPRKVVALLTSIDPKIMKTSTLRIAKEDKFGERMPSSAFKTLGTDRVLLPEELKRFYDKLGNQLHTPTLAQVEKGEGLSAEKLKTLCWSVVAIAEEVLASRVWNSTIGQHSTLRACVNEECGKPVRRRLPDDDREVLDARCQHCEAEYEVRLQSDGVIRWTAKRLEAPCPTSECKTSKLIWERDAKPGLEWQCEGCGHKVGLTLHVDVINEGEPGEPEA